MLFSTILNYFIYYLSLLFTMAIRIVGVDLPQNKRGEIALTYIYGIGRSSSAEG